MKGHFLFWAGGSTSTAEVQIGSLDSTEGTISLGLFLAGPMSTNSAPAYSAGHLLFLTNRILYAQPFDIAARHLKPGPVSIAEDVTAYSVSAAGVLAHASHDEHR